MAFEVTDSRASILRQIRIYLAILQRYRNTSMALHKRHNESVGVLASELGAKIDELSGEYGDDPEITRWRNKFSEYVGQIGLSQ